MKKNIKTKHYSCFKNDKGETEEKKTRRANLRCDLYRHRVLALMTGIIQCYAE